MQRVGTPSTSSGRRPRRTPPRRRGVATRGRAGASGPWMALVVARAGTTRESTAPRTSRQRACLMSVPKTLTS